MVEAAGDRPTGRNRVRAAQRASVGRAEPVLDPDVDPPARTRLGICCSGGGIRSAAYNLGVLQVLRERGELAKATYLSAVSGGSYIAGAFAIVETETADHDLFDTEPPYSRGSPEEAWLRNHSNYIAPGFAGKVRLLLRLLVGIATNLLVVGLFLYAVARPAGWLYERLLLRHLVWHGANPFRTLGAWTLWSVGIPGSLGVLLAWYDVIVRPRRDLVHRELVKYASRLVLIAAAALVVFAVLPYLILLLRHELKDLPSLLQTALRAKPRPKASTVTPTVTTTPGFPRALLPLVGTLVLGALRAVWAKKRSFVVLAVAWVIGPVTLLLTLVWLLSGGATWTRPASFAVWVVVTILFLLFYAFSDLTNWSGHPFYKRLLGEAYAVRRVSKDDAERVPYDKVLKLSECQPAHWPQLRICAAANITSLGVTPPGRRASSFVFSSSRIGGPIIGDAPTQHYEEALGPRVRDLTLLSAVAMSGAAVSPAMGKLTIGPLRFLLAIGGVRLGVWLPNPRWVDKWKSERGMFAYRPRVTYLAKELFGLDSVDDRFLYVTDGGHFENLGLVELLRRGCTQIYCFDASGENDFSFGTLGEAIAIARADVQVDIAIDPSGMTPTSADKGRGPEQLCRNDCVRGTIRYPDGTEGVLIYAKASVTAASPPETQTYWQKNPLFPHDPTFDQLYNDEKFEAYWSLGRSTGRRAVDQMATARADQAMPPPEVPTDPPPRADHPPHVDAVEPIEPPTAGVALASTAVGSEPR